MGLLQLPNETILSITNFLTQVSDIGALVRVNRLLYSLLNLKLYQRGVQRRYGPYSWLSDPLGDKSYIGWWGDSRRWHVDTKRFLEAGAHLGETIKLYVKKVGTLIHDAAYFAIYWGHEEIAQLLFEHGVSFHYYLSDGLCPIETAVRYNRVALIRWMIDNGADFRNHYGKGNGPEWFGGATLLHIACYLGRVEVVELLLEHRADVEAPAIYSPYDYTPLDLTLMYSQSSWKECTWGRPANLVEKVQTCKLLLDYGANPKKKWGRKSLEDYAADYPDVDLLCLLDGYGFDNVTPKGKDLQWKLQAEQVYFPISDETCMDCRIFHPRDVDLDEDCD